jgi:hypothetical protein
MRLPFRRTAVFTDLWRLRVGDETKAQSKLYPSTRRAVSVLAHGGVMHGKSDARTVSVGRASDPKE